MAGAGRGWPGPVWKKDGEKKKKKGLKSKRAGNGLLRVQEVMVVVLACLCGGLALQRRW